MRWWSSISYFSQIWLLKNMKVNNFNIIIYIRLPTRTMYLDFWNRIPIFVELFYKNHWDCIKSFFKFHTKTLKAGSKQCFFQTNFLIFQGKKETFGTFYFSRVNWKKIYFFGKCSPNIVKKKKRNSRFNQNMVNHVFIYLYCVIPRPIGSNWNRLCYVCTYIAGHG